MTTPLKFGAFLVPLHDINEKPTLSLWRDMRLIELLDELDYDEAWVGEHHSGGWANILAPELVIAAVAERTRRIRLATGVISLPYHNPFMVASRAVQLDHLTRGRFILGVGAGSIPSDPHMLGIEQTETRPRTAEALEVIQHLLGSDETITRKTDWFTLQDARLQVAPYSPGGIEIAISSALSPNSMRTAGRMGLGVMSFGSPRPGIPLPDLGRQWRYAEEAAAEAGRTVDRADWRITQTVYVAETREEAYADVRAGFDRWVHGYWEDIFHLPVGIEGVPRGQELEANIEMGNIIVGSVDDAVAGIERLQENTDGFGGMLLMAHDWAPWDKMRRSYELFARYVAPRFTGALVRPRLSADWVTANGHLFEAGYQAAIQQAMGQAAAT
ncbi:LLM class flavin-dependent oxidoreductase [Actinomadura fibrosa]|uniref:LLM class flavin-dependent oxidoreductase n=1 Tax=Actinomadura fibrosa TaxID=111802 RepID=A0ABW2XT84_9ACTN|nr:LLM class flavin-dependent oxidoreductase [Actinomadura fibrosa]